MHSVSTQPQVTIILSIHLYPMFGDRNRCDNYIIITRLDIKVTTTTINSIPINANGMQSKSLIVPTVMNHLPSVSLLNN